MKILEMSSEERPRERLEKCGAEALSAAELLALILKSGTKKENVLVLANRLLSKYGLEKLAQSSLRELEQEHGIGKAKACQLMAVFELWRRIPNYKVEKPKISCAREVAEIYLPKLKEVKEERFYALYLNTKNKIVAEEMVSLGTINSSIVHPREIFHGAVKHLANAVIVLHNHPSGEVQPSAEDLEVTEKLQEAGETLGIPLLDHLIIGKDAWWSWKESKFREN
ncbi:DNA repair protein RadC [Candidatus Woesearchaeota archaeon]|nr:DNA repair protein RadC [Candidatus Woesearchaeota archaeon]